MLRSSSKLTNRFLGVALLGGVAALAALAQNGLVLRYELIELTAPEGGQSRAYSVNNTGQAVGWVQADSGKHSAQWHNRATTDLHGTVHFSLKHPLFDQDYSEAFAISNGGQIVGTARTSIECPPTFVITNAFVLRPSVLSDLATPYPGDALANLMTLGNPCQTAYDSAAIGISNSNYVVGWADRIDGVTHAFLVRPLNGTFVADLNEDLVNDLMIDLGTLAASDPVSSATAVNDAGEVTGYSYTLRGDGTGGYHAFLLTPLDNNADGFPDQWYAGAGGVNDLMTDLGTLGGVNSWGRAINNNGDVVGESDYDAPTGEHYTRAFYWSDGTMTDLGTLRDDPLHGFSAASAINDAGVIVGWAEDEERNRRAFVYRDGVMQDLNDLLYLLDEDGKRITPGITLTEARDINEDGVIVGWGTIRGSSDGSTRGFLLNPVMVDPNALEPTEPDDSNTPAPGDDDNNPPTDYSGVPDFGAPDTGDDTDPNDGTPNGGVSPISLCGASGTAMLPLTLAGLCWLRWGRRRPV
ncbi:MAG TPA: DUF3466 family protein [Phycisphaerae bacterium]|nr:DUF3466 family protein [Phycisphaerae bacterium]